MANFRRHIKKEVGTAAETIMTANSKDCVIGFRICNITSSSITVDVTLTTSGSDTIHLQKNTPIDVGGSLEVSGINKLVFVDGDVVKVKSSASASADVLVSVVDAISS